MHFIERLFAAMLRVQNPVVVGIDPRPEELPPDFLDRFPEGLDLYARAMGEHVLASEIEPALRAHGVPPRHARIIGARVEVEASHVAELSRWAAYQVATAYLTREVEVNPDRERFFERAAARAILLPSPGSDLGSASA